ncbi:MAG: hypothetical protein HJJLKODD_01115 [Phycisphaerae bacterium]|nr:hypothetical protein [Phycisphaerae bacterium]
MGHSSKKLILNRETVRVLNAQDLKFSRGAVSWSAFWCPPESNPVERSLTALSEGASEVASKVVSQSVSEGNLSQKHSGKVSQSVSEILYSILTVLC